MKKKNSKNDEKTVRLPNPKVEMFGSQILVLPIKAAEFSEGGIELPDVGKERPNRGYVIAVGPDVRGRVKRGDVVAYGKYDGIDWPSGGEEFTILAEKELKLKEIK